MGGESSTTLPRRQADDPGQSFVFAENGTAVDLKPTSVDQPSDRPRLKLNVTRQPPENLSHSLPVQAQSEQPVAGQPAKHMKAAKGIALCLVPEPSPQPHPLNRDRQPPTGRQDPPIFGQGGPNRQQNQRAEAVDMAEAALFEGQI